MAWASTEERYGLVSIVLHWTMAVMIIVLFFWGGYMTDLEYTHPWYQLAPRLHKSLGLIVFALLVIRMVWVLLNKKPAPVPMPDWERITAWVVQKLFYLLLLGISFSGYLIPTANGRPVEFFNLFELPAIVSNIDRQEDIAGDIHRLLTHVIMAVVVLHALAALKHHFLDRDETLIRMLGIKTKET
ncbi:MAG: cytochrome b [Deltaproteobacteria bacterium]|nr:cytochrome b [Deltaproteobacteria bacterium]